MAKRKRCRIVKRSMVDVCNQIHDVNGYKEASKKGFFGFDSGVFYCLGGNFIWIYSDVVVSIKGKHS